MCVCACTPACVLACERACVQSWACTHQLHPLTSRSTCTRSPNRLSSCWGKVEAAFISERYMEVARTRARTHVHGVWTANDALLTGCSALVHSTPTHPVHRVEPSRPAADDAEVEGVGSGGRAVLPQLAAVGLGGQALRAREDRRAPQGQQHSMIETFNERPLRANTAPHTKQPL